MGLGDRVAKFSGLPYFNQTNAYLQYKKAEKRLLYLDTEGTIMPPNFYKGNIYLSNQTGPAPEILASLQRLCNDKRNVVCCISSRGRLTMEKWFAGIDNIILSSENGYYFKMGTESVSNTWNKISHSSLYFLYSGNGNV